MAAHLVGLAAVGINLVQFAVHDWLCMTSTRRCKVLNFVLTQVAIGAALYGLRP